MVTHLSNIPTVQPVDHMSDALTTRLPSPDPATSPRKNSGIWIQLQQIFSHHGINSIRILKGEVCSFVLICYFFPLFLSVYHRNFFNLMISPDNTLQSSIWVVRCAYFLPLEYWSSIG